MITVIYYSTTETTTRSYPTRAEALRAAYQAARDGYRAIVNY